MKNLKNKLTKKEKKLLGGFYYGIKLKRGYFFPLSGKLIPFKKIRKEKNAKRIEKTIT